MLCERNDGAQQIRRQGEDFLATGVLDLSVSAPGSSGVAEGQSGCMPWQLIQKTDVKWPVGLMDKASAPGAGDSRFESWAGHFWPCFQAN